MATYKIPKQARNKYNFIEGADDKRYVTAAQYMNAMSGGSGNNINSNTFSQNTQMSSAIKAAIREMIDSGDLVDSSSVESIVDSKMALNSSSN